MIVYVDSSALVPLMKTEDRSNEVSAYLDDLVDDQHLLVSSQLLETELHRAAWRQGISSSVVASLIDIINVFELEPSDFSVAGQFPVESLGSLDALHLAAAQRAGASVMITFDSQLAGAAVAMGISVLDTSKPRARV
jgi:predicted nucleic acid-binding protein